MTYTRRERAHMSPERVLVSCVVCGLSCQSERSLVVCLVRARAHLLFVLSEQELTYFFVLLERALTSCLSCQSESSLVTRESSLVILFERNLPHRGGFLFEQFPNDGGKGLSLKNKHIYFWKNRCFGSQDAMQCVTMSCSGLQRVAACCSVLQCVPHSF